MTLKRVPVDVWQRASAHQDAIQREFEILMADLDDGSVPHQFAELAINLDVQFRGVGDTTWAQLYAAAERGESEVDLVFTVPVEVASAAAEVNRMLDQVDEFCRDGEQLLTLATPPELASFRHWFLGEFTRQIESGRPPTSWPQYEEPLDGKATGSTKVPDVGDDELIDFEGELDLVTAGALRERIVNSRVAGGGNVQLDLSKVTFIDSVGISLLVTAHNRIADDGGHLRIIFPQRLRRFLEIAGLVEVLDLEFVDHGDGLETPGADS